MGCFFSQLLILYNALVVPPKKSYTFILLKYLKITSKIFAMNSRRIFIKDTLGSFAALAAGSNVFSAILLPKQKQKLGVALVGLGYYSTDLLAPALQLTELCYLAGIVTGTPAKAERWKKQYNLADKNIYNYNDFDRVANNPDIDVIYVV